MNKKEIEALDRKARELAPHLSFYRHSPRETRWVPMAETAPEHFVRDAFIGSAILAGMFALIVTAPWWA